jgi:transposase
MRYKDMTIEEINIVIKRVEEAIKFDLALTSGDLVLLLDAFKSCLHIQEKLSGKDITILKLRKLLGMVASSEHKSNLKPKEDSTKPGKSDLIHKSRKRVRPKKPVFPPKKPDIQHHRLEEYTKGSDCPCCSSGKLYKFEPSQFTRIVGSAPFSATVHISERLKCNQCDKYYTAELPEEVKNDGGSGQKYGYSARALIGIYKYFTGFPFYRQETLQNMLGIPITTSTQVNQSEYLANAGSPIHKALIKNAANAPHFHEDDTKNKIVDEKPKMMKKRGSNDEHMRSGIFSSGIIATTKEDRDIVLFKTNIGYSGEFLDEILQYRDLSLPSPTLMSDALSSNKPTKIVVDWSKCNVHARREFFNLSSSYHEEAVHIVTEYDKIFAFEAESKKKNLSKGARLIYHKKNSLPILEGIFKWCEEKLTEQIAEANGPLAKACNYILNHKDGLQKFCEIEGAQVDNNKMERILKMVILGRKNFHVFRTLVGAAISDTILSLAATAYSSGVNIFEYFVAIQRFSKHVKENPHLWFPWKYEETVAGLSS